MQRSRNRIAYWPSIGLALAMTLLSSTLANADGVAVFASLTDDQLAEAMRGTLRDTVGAEVEASIIIINGTRWTRLHSRTMPEQAARALVAKAQSGGYSAWYNGSGDSLASSSSATAIPYVEIPRPTPK